ncbi:Endonuclease/exonuclease/phosphatase [Morchella snyderi]|nr:Endonuclease/exonuclease/phosphatase [Morchella snyderi]
MGTTTNKHSFLRIIQHNCNNSNSVLISLFSIPMIQNTHIIAAQEVPLIKGKPPSAPSFTAVYPTPTLSDDNISVCTDINNNYFEKNAFASIACSRGDIISTNLFCHTGPNTHITIAITNIYNRQLREGTRSVPPHDFLTRSDNPLVALGDMNIHNPATDPARNFSYRELRLSQPYMDTATREGYSILNTPGTYTRLAPNQNNRNGVIDLAFTNHRATPLIRKWLPLTNMSGSDHRVIAISLALPDTDFALYTTPNWKLTDWNTLTKQLQDIQLPSCNSPAEIDE